MILITFADFVTELMEFEADKVIIGRENATQETFSNNYIVIDTLVPSKPISTNKFFDYENEKQTINTLFETKVTVEFYGSDTYLNSYKFINMLKTQLNNDLQKKYNIAVFSALNVNNHKQMLGNKYFDRFEIEITIQYNESLTIDTMRIDEIPFNVEQN